MNERIYELLSQAGYVDKGNNHTAYMNFDHEKFAELIVRECCDIIVELRTRPADLAVKDVKKHFGVEQ